MDVTVTESGPCRRTMKIVVPPERIRDHVDEVYREAAQQVQVKGFRRGKVPRALLEKKIGSNVLVEAKSSLIDRCFRDAIRQHALAPLGEPKLDAIDDRPLDASVPFQFQVHFDVRPHIEITATKGIEVARGDPTVVEQDIEGALRQLSEQKRTLRPVTGVVEDGDFVKVDQVFRDEQGVVVHERKDSRLNTNIPIAGTDPQLFAARLRGAEQGQHLEIEITYPQTFEKPEVRGTKGTVTLTLHEILRVIPAQIDDELAKAFDFESLDKLKSDLGARLAVEKERANQRRQEEDIFNILLNEHRFDLPESMVENQAQASLAEFRERLTQAQVAAEEVDRRVKEAGGEARQDAERRVRLFFLLEAIADKEKIFVTEGDVEAELRRIASENNVTAEQVRQYYEQQRLLGNLRLGVKERKVREFLRANAKLTD